MNLAIAFGSRGVANASAHYEPGRKVINLTKLKGAGSLAHELGHAIDHYLYTLCGLTGDLSKCYLSAQISSKSSIEKLPDEYKSIGEAMLKVVNTMRRNDDYQTTEYYTSACNLDKNRVKKYYSYIVEMFARAFESYVEDKLTERGMVSQYLVHSTRSNSLYGDLAPYPTGVERIRIDNAIEILIKEVKNVIGDQGFIGAKLYDNKDNFISYAENIVNIDKRTNKVIDETDDKPKRIFNSVKDYHNKIIEMNKKLGVDDIDSGNTDIEKMNFWTDQAQNKGLIGRIGFGTVKKPQGVSKAFEIRGDIIIIDKKADNKLEATIEAMVNYIVLNTVEKEQKSLLCNTLTVIMLTKESIDVSKYLKDKGYTYLIKNNQLSVSHMKMAYNTLVSLVN